MLPPKKYELCLELQSGQKMGPVFVLLFEHLFCKKRGFFVITIIITRQEGVLLFYRFYFSHAKSKTKKSPKIL